MTQKPLAWIDYARTHIGLKEIPGAKHNPTITKWLLDLGAWWKDDETPWCGVFVAHVLKKHNRKIPKHWYRALAFDQNVMTKLSKPAYGCVVTFGRKGGGHVGFVVGKDAQGRLLVLGGNQGNEVNIRAFDVSRVVGYYWPIQLEQTIGQPDESRYKLENIKGSFKLSNNEA